MHSNPRNYSPTTQENLVETLQGPLFDESTGASTRDTTQPQRDATSSRDRYSNTAMMEKTSMDNTNMHHVGSRRQNKPFYYRHIPKNILLVVFSFFTLPFSTFLVGLSLLYARLYPTPKPIALPNGSRERKTILVTGVSMTKGLVIARLLAKHTPHRIIGADISPFSPGRFSSAIEKFFQLRKPHGNDVDPYVDSLLDVISAEEVNLWISCSSVVAAVEDGTVVRLAEQIRGEDAFKAIQFGEEEVSKLHEKDQFIEYASALGLTVPESHRCTCPEQVLSVLFKNSSHQSDHEIREGQDNGDGGQKFILKPIGVDDRARDSMMTLLPFASPTQTASYIKSLDISPSNPFQLQQYIRGEEYCTHALIVRGTVRAFVACPSSELLMHYYALPASSPLSKAMLKFTETIAEDNGDSFTGHLSFDFLVPHQQPPAQTQAQAQAKAPVSEAREKEMEMERLWMKGSEKKSKKSKKNKNKKSSSSSLASTSTSASTSASTSISPAVEKIKPTKTDSELTIYPIECNPRAHTAVALFADTPGMATAYLSVFDAPLSRRPSFSSIRSMDSMSALVSPRQYHKKDNPLAPHAPTSEYYWVGHDVMTLIVLPLLDTVFGQARLEQVLHGAVEFWEHVVGWKEGTFDVADPVPFWVLYQVYWPVCFLERVVGGRAWSRVNVSTTKVFEG